MTTTTRFVRPRTGFVCFSCNRPTRPIDASASEGLCGCCYDLASTHNDFSDGHYIASQFEVVTSRIRKIRETGGRIDHDTKILELVIFVHGVLHSLVEFYARGGADVTAGEVERWVATALSVDSGITGLVDPVLLTMHLTDYARERLTALDATILY